MPMRVDIATLVSRLTRRSTQRLIQAATNMNSVSVNSSFSTDQTVMRLLPAATPRLSSVAMMGSSQPRYSAAIASQMSSATRRFPILNPGFVAQARGKHQHGAAHHDVREDQARRGAEQRDVEMRRQQRAVGDQHQHQHDDDGRDHHVALRAEIPPRQAPSAACLPGADCAGSTPSPPMPPSSKHTASTPTSISTLRVERISKNASMRSQISFMRSDPV